MEKQKQGEHYGIEKTEDRDMCIARIEKTGKGNTR